MKTFQLVFALACFAAVRAGLLPAGSYDKSEDADAYPSYNFSYDVQDAETGDIKSQSETRDGDVVRGQYALNDADGYRRIVDYSVEGESGFQAVVRREPLASPGAFDTVAIPLKVHESMTEQKQAGPARDESSSVLDARKPPKVVVQPLRHPATYISSYAAPTLVHHAPAQTLFHHASPALHLAPSAHFIHSAAQAGRGQTLIHHALPAVHLAPTAHIVHAAPLLKHSPAIIHHHSPAVVKTSFSTPHVSYVY